jgi:hypothetical protein
MATLVERILVSSERVVESVSYRKYLINCLQLYRYLSLRSGPPDMTTNPMARELLWLENRTFAAWGCGVQLDRTQSWSHGFS